MALKKKKEVKMDALCPIFQKIGMDALLEDLGDQTSSKVSKATIEVLTPAAETFADLTAATTAHNAVVAKINAIISAMG
jgi:hypothetical protein